MRLEKLLNQRTIAPGLIFAVFALPLLLGPRPLAVYIDALGSLEGVFYTLVVIGIGGAYHALRLRDGAAQPIWDAVNEPIVVTLVDCAMANPEVALARGALLTHRSQVMNMAFYHFIDTDPSLKAKSQRVYHNGSFVTACVDMYVLGLFFAVLYFLLYALAPEHERFFALGSFLLVFLAGFAYYQALPVIVAHHIELGAEQLQIITVQYKFETEQQLSKLAKSLAP